MPPSHAHTETPLTFPIRINSAQTSYFNASQIYKGKANETSSFFLRQLSSGSRSGSYTWYGRCSNFGDGFGTEQMRWGNRLMRYRRIRMQLRDLALYCIISQRLMKVSTSDSTYLAL
jgi:hypothetical protein